MSLYCNIVCVWSLDIIISMSRLFSILSFICCILYYSVDDLLHKTSTHTVGYQTHKMPRISKTNIMKAQYGKLNMINTSFIVAPVENNNVLPPSKRAIHSECDIANVSPDTVIHGNCFKITTLALLVILTKISIITRLLIH